MSVEDWSLFDGDADRISLVDELDPMFNSFGEYNGTNSQDVESSDGEQTADLGFGNNHTFGFESLVTFPDDEAYHCA